jgi:hypothetical protein
MSGSTRVWDEVNRRLVETMSAAGLSEGSISREILFLLPRDFVMAYEALYHRAVRTGLEGRRDIEVEVTDKKGEGTGEYETLGGVVKARGGRRSRLAEGESLGGMAGARKGKAYKQAWTVADERALDLKHKMDKRLRKIAREVKVFLEGEMEGSTGEGGEQERKKCAGKGCGKWLEHGWKYCPFCGGRQRTKSGVGAG